MQAYQFEKSLTASHRLEIDLPPNAPTAGRAQIIVLFPDAQHGATAESATPPQAQDLAALFSFLKTVPPTGRSKEEIDTQIDQERESWE